MLIGAAGGGPVAECEHPETRIAAKMNVSNFNVSLDHAIYEEFNPRNGVAQFISLFIALVSLPEQLCSGSPCPNS